MMKINVKGTIIPNDDQWIYDLFDIDAISPARVLKDITAAAENFNSHAHVERDWSCDTFGGKTCKSQQRQEPL